MKNVQKKGKDFERWVAKDLAKTFGVKVRRTPCSGGIHDFMSQDIICIDQKSILNELHIECKKRKKLNVYEAYDKANGLAGIGKKTLVVWGKDFKDVIVILSYYDFINYLKELEDSRKGGV